MWVFHADSRRHSTWPNHSFLDHSFLDHSFLADVLDPHPFSTGPCLLHDSTIVSQELVAALGAAVEAIGITVSSFALDELSFAPEIAATMLQRQAAQALVDARAVIVRGAAELTAGAIAALTTRGIVLTAAQRTRLVGSLLPVLCATDRDGAEHD